MNERYERLKYDKMHSVQGYSPGPGVSRVSTAVQQYITKGSSVIDFGCGTGDAAKEFQSLGYDVCAVDISTVGLQHEDLRFFHAPLHDLPKTLPPATWGFCIDVMEHLPTRWVGESLAQMAKKVDNCYFVISSVPDSWGKRINDVLHLSVMPASWWLGEISDHWSDVLLTIDDGACFEIIAKGAKR